MPPPRRLGSIQAAVQQPPPLKRRDPLAALNEELSPQGPKDPLAAASELEASAAEVEKTGFFGSAARGLAESGYATALGPLELMRSYTQALMKGHGLTGGTPITDRAIGGLRQGQEEAREFYGEPGSALGHIGGRLVGDVGQFMASGAGIAKAVPQLGRLASEGSFVQRALAQAALGTPLAAVQGAGVRPEESLAGLIPGAEGIAQNPFGRAAVEAVAQVPFSFLGEGVVAGLQRGKDFLKQMGERGAGAGAPTSSALESELADRMSQLQNAVPSAPSSPRPPTAQPFVQELDPGLRDIPGVEHAALEPDYSKRLMDAERAEGVLTDPLGREMTVPEQFEAVPPTTPPSMETPTYERRGTLPSAQRAVSDAGDARIVARNRAYRSMVEEGLVDKLSPEEFVNELIVRQQRHISQARVEAAQLSRQKGAHLEETHAVELLDEGGTPIREKGRFTAKREPYARRLQSGPFFNVDDQLNAIRKRTGKLSVSDMTDDDLVYVFGRDDLLPSESELPWSATLEDGTVIRGTTAEEVVARAARADLKRRYPITSSDANVVRDTERDAVENWRKYRGKYTRSGQPAIQFENRFGELIDADQYHKEIDAIRKQLRSSGKYNYSGPFRSTAGRAAIGGVIGGAYGASKGEDIPVGERFLQGVAGATIGSALGAMSTKAARYAIAEAAGLPPRIPRGSIPRALGKKPSVKLIPRPPGRMYGDPSIDEILERPTPEYFSELDSPDFQVLGIESEAGRNMAITDDLIDAIREVADHNNVPMDAVNKPMYDAYFANPTARRAALEAAERRSLQLAADLGEQVIAYDVVDEATGQRLFGVDGYISEGRAAIDVTGDIPGKLGPRKVREALRQFFELHKDVKYVEGNRITGARVKADRERAARGYTMAEAQGELNDEYGKARVRRDRSLPSGPFIVPSSALAAVLGPSAARVGSGAALGTLGFGLAAQDENETLKKTGYGLMALGFLHGTGFHRWRAAGRAANTLVKAAADASPLVRRAVAYVDPEALLSKDILKAIENFETGSAKYAARGERFASLAEKLGPEADRFISDVVEAEQWAKYVPKTAEETKQILALAADAINNFNEILSEKQALGLLPSSVKGGEYLPRYHARKLAEEAEGFISKSRMDLPTPPRVQREGRRVIPAADRDTRNYLGEIRESSFRVRHGLAAQGRQIASAKLFQALRPMKGVMNPDYAKLADDVMAAIKTGDQNAIKAARDALDKFSRGFSPQPGSKWDRLPEMEGLGVLSGAIVNREVAQVLRGLPQYATAWDKILRLWKGSKTAFNPPTHVGNTASNVFLTHMAGLYVHEQPFALARAIKDLSNYGPATKALAERGILNRNVLHEGGTGLAAQRLPAREELRELARTTRPETAAALKEFGLTPRTKYASLEGLKKVGRGFEKAYANEDNAFRVALYQKAIKPKGGLRGGFGMSSDEAAEYARHKLVDYRSRSPLLSLARRSVFPFVLFSAKAIPMVTASIIEHPWRYLPFVGALWFAAEREKEAEPSLTERDVPRNLRSPWPGHMLPTAVPTGIFPGLSSKGGEGQRYFTDVSRFSPFSAVTTGAPPGAITGQAFGENFPAALQPSGPLMDLAGLALNKDPYTGREIVRPGDRTSLPLSVLRMAEYSAARALPTFAGLHIPRVVQDLMDKRTEDALVDALGFIGTRPRIVQTGEAVRRARARFNETVRDLEQKYRHDASHARENPERVKDLQLELQDRLRAAAEQLRAELGP